ncbi:hypothetical protein [Actinoalloteichus spitiensis]|uniref:hypothetical protein n=1 Tax=Actinoalloteichus spitiensis TaxID=252394 RepID=UPI001FE1D04F|nr:hypothetical protein [Actinoalloteichus spitiensis]
MNQTPEPPGRAATTTPSRPSSTAEPRQTRAHPAEEPTSPAEATTGAGRNGRNAGDEITGAWLTRCAVRTPIVGRLYGHVDLDTGHGPLVAPGLRYLVGTFDHRRTVLCGAVVRHCAEFDDLTTDTIAEMRDLARRWRVREFVPPPTTLKRRRRRVPWWARVRFWSWEPEVELGISCVGRVSFTHADWARIGNPTPTSATLPTTPDQK